MGEDFSRQTRKIDAVWREKPHRRRSTVVNTDSKKWVGAAALSRPLAAILKIAIGGLTMEYCSIR